MKNEVAPMAFIEMKNIRKSFGSQEILHGVSLSVEKGEVVSIIGPSGAGKSTFLRCLNNLETIQGGSIRVEGDYLAEEKDGKVVYANDALSRKILGKMGMVFQSFNLFPHMTVLDNLLAAPVYVKKMKKEDVMPTAERLLRKVGLWDKKDVYPGSLSGGQKQRVAIARALTMAPEIMLFDEPTSALDPETVKSILQLLKDINKKLGITIIMITHQMEVIKQIADRVAVIENGRIIEESSVVDLFTAPKTETSRKFIGSVISNYITESLQHIHFTPDKHHHGHLTALRLSFRGDVADEPIVANLIRKYNLDVSILYGNIDYIHGVPFGKLIVTMDGNETDISAALSHLKNLPIESEVIGYVSGNH